MQLDLCPKCAHVLSTSSNSCPCCGVIFAKYSLAEALRVKGQQEGEDRFISQLLLYVKPSENSAVIVIKSLFLGILALYGLKLIFTPILAFPETSWLLHNINLAFHEAGHVFFSPFGRFLHVLGGTLGQLIIPAVVIATFLLQRDTFGASVGLWWLGESLLDIAPYINDARAGQLMLVGGVTGSEVEDYHDWEVLLSKLGMMRYDHTLAKTAFIAGSLLILTAIAWGSYLLLKSWWAHNKT